VVPQDASASRANNDIDLFRLWDILWRSRWLIAGVTAAFAVGSVTYAYFATPMYTATVVLAPVKDEPLSGLAGQLGGLAGLAAIAGVRRDNTDALAVLRSRDFVRTFVEEEELLPVLFPKAWDAATGRWKVEKPPEPSQGAGYFVAKVRSVEESATSGLVTLSIEWRDPELAASWANSLAARLNDHMRQRALADAENNVKYLRHELENTSVVTLQQSIGSLLESEMQKVMLARGNSEYAFRIIDRAEVPRAPSKPRVMLIVVLATFFGAMLASFVALVRDMVKNRAPAGPATTPGPRAD
jgi:uncharacterized protein involved in exopolysaccharide biosynthesis